MTEAGFAKRCADVCAGFVATGPVRKARKSELLPGEVDGRPAIAKRMRKPNAVWDWYFAHEVAVYRAFANGSPSFAVPHVFAAADDVIVIERFPTALAKLRRPYAELPASTLEALLAMRDAIAVYAFPSGTAVPDSPPSRVKSQLQQRLLEDFTDPSWIRDGLTRCHGRGLIDDDVHDAAIAALLDAPLAPSHGDLLLRNAMQRADGTVVLVDWECAGLHVAAWDLALLWTQLASAGRAIVETRVTGRALWALTTFALCRELVFLDAFRTPDDHAGRRRVETDLEAVTSRLLG